VLGNVSGFDVGDDIPDVFLECLGMKMLFCEGTEGIDTEQNLCAVWTEHEGERIESTIEGPDGVDGTFVGLGIKEGADVEILVGFEADLRVILVG